MPFLKIEYKDKYFFSIKEGLGVKVHNNEKFELAVVLSPSFGRDADDHLKLNGLGNVDPSVDFKLIVAYKMKYCKFGLDYLYDLDSGYDGYTFKPKVITRIPFKKGFVIVNAYTTYANNSYMDCFFSVDSIQASNSGLTVYNAEKKFKDLGVSFIVNYKISDALSLNTMFGYKRLLNDAGDSPIVEDKNQYNGSLFLVHKF
jgi:outer membrane scaffolding protein for murein synthesis (MipA/OmpV family)